MGSSGGDAALRIVVIVILAVNGVFTLIMLGHSIFVYNYFHGPPPTEDFRIGQIVLTVGLALAIFTIIFALFMKLFDLKSLSVVIIIDLILLSAIVLHLISMYYFRNTEPTIQEFQNYTRNYFNVHGRPPPFFNKIQHEMNGYCCGSSSYLDYVNSTDRDFFDIPHSCCFRIERETNPECGKHEWKYLYMFLEGKKRQIFNLLEKKYVDTDDITAVLLSVTRSHSQEFIRANYRAMLNDREANLKKSMNSSKYKVLQDEVKMNNPYLEGKQLDERVSQIISKEAVIELDDLLYQFSDPKMIMFLPVGCLDMMDEVKNHKWKGFRRFKFLRTHVISTFQGIWGMIVCNTVLLVISTVVFNVKGHAIDKGPTLTAFTVLHTEEAKEEREKMVTTVSSYIREEDQKKEEARVSAAALAAAAAATVEDSEEEELQSLIKNSVKSSSTIHSLTNDHVDSLHLDDHKDEGIVKSSPK